MSYLVPDFNHKVKNWLAGRTDGQIDEQMDVENDKISSQGYEGVFSNGKLISVWITKRQKGP